LKKDDYLVQDLRGYTINKEVSEIKFAVDQIEKGDFKHFMLKEIFEQPRAIQEQ